MPAKKKDKNPILPVLFPTTSKGEQTNKELLAERDYAISCKFQTGTKIPALMKEYNLSRRHVYHVISVHIEAAKQWGASLPESTAIALHEMVARKSFETIQRIDALIKSAETAGEIGLALQGSIKLYDCYIKYKDIITNGATLHETLKIIKEAKRVIDTGGTK